MHSSRALLPLLAVLGCATTPAPGPTTAAPAATPTPAAAPAPEATPATPATPAFTRVAIGAPAAGMGRVALFHLAPALASQRIDAHTMARPQPGFRRVAEGVAYGEAAAWDVAPGSVNFGAVPAGAEFPRSPALFSGPSVAADGIVHVVAFGEPAAGQSFGGGHLDDIEGSAPAGQTRVSWYEVRGVDRTYQVCLGGASTTYWFDVALSGSGSPVSRASASPGLVPTRDAPSGAATIELRERGGANCAGAVRAAWNVTLPPGRVKLLHVVRAEGAALYVCPLTAPFDCARYTR